MCFENFLGSRPPANMAGVTSSAVQLVRGQPPVSKTRHSCLPSFLSPKSASRAFWAYSQLSTLRSPVMGVPKQRRKSSERRARLLMEV